MLSSVLAALTSQLLAVPHGAGSSAGSTAPAESTRLQLSAQRLPARFTAGGVQVTAGGATLGLSLRAIGYARSLTRVAAVTPTFHANRVLYARPQVREWYVNGPLGLEQGFTLSRAPSIRAPGPLTISLAISGDVGAHLASGSQSIIFSGPRGAVLRYGALHVTDARGHTLHSWLALGSRQVRLIIDSAGARYPLRIDPLIQEARKLPVSEETGPGRVGMGVALSADGKTALAGGPSDNNSAGAIWFFERGSEGWLQQGSKITAEAEGAGGTLCGEAEEGEEGEAECAFGESVALSADGNTAIAGGPRRAGPCRSGEAECRRQGAAWVYARSKEGRWSLQAKLTGGSEETPDGRFGRSVAISADGNTALVGASTDRNAAGAAWVFTRTGDTWSQQGPKLTDPSESGEANFGVSVAISADGNTALIGGPRADGKKGAVWVFDRSGSSWGTLAATLTGGEEQGEGHFGFSVALSGDGSTALVGGREDNEGAGAAWVFTRSSTEWLQQGGKLTGGSEAESPSAFGYSVSLSHDGNTALIGGPRDDVRSGAAWLFRRAESTWSQEGEKLTGIGDTPHGARFGSSIALRSDGDTALIGAPSDAGKAGAVWAFGDPAIIPGVTSVSPDAGPVAGGTTVTITGSRLAGATAVEFVSASCNKADEEGCSTPAASFTVNPSGSITAVSPPRPEGTTYVVVTNIEGQSGLSSASEFTYLQVPAVSEISPTEGSTSGGTPVTITGNHLGNASAVDFGAVGARSFTVNSDGSITAVAPPEPAGTVSVTVTTPGGKSRETGRNRFTFTSAGSAATNGSGATGGGGGVPSGGVLAFASGCRPSLASRKIVVLTRNRAKVRLIWRGSAACRGKLRLSARVRVGKRFKSKTIGVATFSISPGRISTVIVKLNAAGHALLRGGHGRLRATLLIGSLPPAARSAATANVRLVLQRTTATKPKTH
jgi:IPT/TIG domain/FG-GAP repeat